MKIFLKLSACVAVAAAYGVLLAMLPFFPLTFALGVLVCNWLANLVHELGHLAAYFLTGLQWKRMVVSFFVFDRKEGFRFDGQQRIYAASCTCAYDPQVPYWRYCVALLSGGALGCLSGGVAILTALQTTGAIAAFLLCFGPVSILNGAVNLLLPFASDRVLLRQIRNERE